MKYGSSIIVTGTREKLMPHQADIVERILGDILCEFVGNVFVGDCPTGVDAVVREIVREYNFESAVEDRWNLRVFKADWKQYGRRAGPLRNAEMVGACAKFRNEYPTKHHAALAIPGETSKGTWDCVRSMADAGFKVAVMPINMLESSLGGSLEMIS